MKKKSFFSRLGAKMALAAVALTSALFVGCSEEDLEITGPGTEPIVLPNPICTISVNVFNLTGEEMKDLSLTTTSNNATINGNSITLTGESISEQDIVITATATGYIDGKATVKVPNLTKGQTASFSATILMIKENTGDDYKLTKLLAVDSNYEEVNKESENYENPNDYLVNAKFHYVNHKGTEVNYNGLLESEIDEVKEIGNQLNQSFSSYTKNVETWAIKVPHYHWAKIASKVSITTITYNATIESKDGKVETYDFITKDYGTTITETLEALPTHSHAHCDNGHGHTDHGHGADNAGGGIVNPVN